MESKGADPTTYKELIPWLKANNVSVRDAKFAVHVMIINGREEPQPSPCPYCKKDLNKVGQDNVGNAYYCTACKGLLQVG